MSNTALQCGAYSIVTKHSLPAGVLRSLLYSANLQVSYGGRLHFATHRSKRAASLRKRLLLAALRPCCSSCPSCLRFVVFSCLLVTVFSSPHPLSHLQQKRLTTRATMVIQEPTFPSSTSNSTMHSQRILIFDTSSTHLTASNSSTDWWPSFVRRSKAFYHSSISSSSQAEKEVEVEVLLISPPSTPVEDLASYARSIAQSEDALSHTQTQTHIKENQTQSAKRNIAFGVVHSWSAERDALELVLLFPPSATASSPSSRSTYAAGSTYTPSYMAAALDWRTTATSSSCGSSSSGICSGNLVGPRFALSWPPLFTSSPHYAGKHIHDIFPPTTPFSLPLPAATRIIRDNCGVARRMANELLVKAHCSTEWKAKKDAKELEQEGGGGRCTWHAGGTRVDVSWAISRKFEWRVARDGGD